MTDARSVYDRCVVLRTIRIAVCAAAAALVVAGCGAPVNVGDASTVTVPREKRREPISLAGTSIDGARVSVEELRGRVVVMNLWQSTCGPCRKEAPDLAAVYQSRVDRGVSFLGLNTGEANKDAAEAFQRRFEVPYPSVWDEHGTALLALRGAVSPKAIPSTIILDRSGRIAVRFSGMVSSTTLTQAIDAVAVEP